MNMHMHRVPEPEVMFWVTEAHRHPPRKCIEEPDLTGIFADRETFGEYVWNVWVGGADSEPVACCTCFNEAVLTGQIVYDLSTQPDGLTTHVFVKRQSRHESRKEASA